MQYIEIMLELLNAVKWCIIMLGGLVFICNAVCKIKQAAIINVLTRVQIHYIM